MVQSVPFFTAGGFFYKTPLIRVHPSPKIGIDNGSLPYSYCNLWLFNQLPAPVDFYQKEPNNQGANLCNPF